MARPRALKNPPIQEAIIQFEFGESELAKSELEALASVYQKEGWTRLESRAFQATIGDLNTGSPTVLQAIENFLGFVVTAPNGVDIVQIRSSQVSASKRHYSSWEDLTKLASQAFDHYISVSQAQKVTKVSTRFINRLPPFPEFATFNDILERPPLPIEGIEDASISDFMRRHVIKSIRDGYVATLTLGTVVKEPGESLEGAPLVIDADVSKTCDVKPTFDLLLSDLGVLRHVKNAMFFGSLKEAVVEKFL